MARLADKLAEVSAATSREPGESALNLSNTSGSIPPHLRRLGDFDLAELIGEGGMGTVYLAHQRSLSNRRVALKVLPPHFAFDAKRVARFRREAETAARIQHPNIVSVLSVGEQDGIHFLAQELVKGGRSLANWITEQRDITDAPTDHYRTLASQFAKVASGLQAVHAANVVHRDVKPSNILLTSDNEPKVADFGLAKDLESGAGLSSGESPGTPIYMSPEHVDCELGPVDARSDVFSLGSTFYEALTLVRPFAGGSYPEIYDKIRNREVADPRTERVDVPAELALICLKMLEKARPRRYASMQEVADDLRRYLANEPIHASPPSAPRRARLWIARNPVASVLMLASLVVLVGSIVAVRTVTARAEETRIVAAFQSRLLDALSVDEFGHSLVASLRAEITRAQDRQNVPPSVRDDALSSFDRVVAAANATNVAQHVLQREVFEPALVAIEQDFADRPLIRAALSQPLSETLLKLGLYPLAERAARSAMELYRTELGSNSQKTFVAATSLGLILQPLGKLEEAESLLRDTQLRTSANEGPQSPNTLLATTNLARVLHVRGKLVEAEKLYREALQGQRRVLAADNPELLATANFLGMLLFQKHEWKEAEDLWTEVRGWRRAKLGDNDVETMASTNNLAALCQAQGNLHEAEDLYREAWNGYRAKLGDNHPTTVLPLINLAGVTRDQGRLTDAEPLAEAALKRGRAAFGDTHVHTLVAIHNLARLRMDRGRLDEAETLFREALEGRRNALGDENLDTFTTSYELGQLLIERDKLSEAELLACDAFEGRRRILGANDRDTLLAMNGLANVLLAKQNAPDAELLLLELVARRSAISEQRDNGLSNSLSLLAWALRLQRRYDEAEPLLRKALDGYRSKYGDEHYETRTLINNLGMLELARNRFRESEGLLLEQLGTVETMAGSTEEQAREPGKRLIQLYQKWHDADPTGGHDVQAAELRERFRVTRSELP